MASGQPDYTAFTIPVLVPDGGTGRSSLTAHGVLFGAGTAPVGVAPSGGWSTVLRIKKGDIDPSFGAVELGEDAAVVGILGKAFGGTGLANPGLVAGTGIAVTDLWPNQTITNTSPASALGDPVTIAHGGTGTATPALVAGANITITGSWPNNTIALTSPITGVFTVGDGAGEERLSIDGGAGSLRGCDFRTAGVQRWVVYVSGAAESGGNAGSQFVVARCSDAGAVLGYPLFIRRSDGQVGMGTVAPTSALQVVGLPVYANNAAAVAGGLTAGAFYRTGADPDPVCVVH